MGKVEGYAYDFIPMSSIKIFVVGEATQARQVQFSMVKPFK
jgi:hypothetical protein